MFKFYFCRSLSDSTTCSLRLLRLSTSVVQSASQDVIAASATELTAAAEERLPLIRETYIQSAQTLCSDMENSRLIVKFIVISV